ncbi:transcriptional regulator, GntR family [Thermanaeromonas toyohensis ToBE]|uniref:Transcriptional regulator, GntR family n=1 Tax=Thermanaeromonas toyohensis ToBE TaxID=698762 RepID=A0A1W1W2E9_9FIRM|nr:GntR family transcriptional regulator [Thermanaeromonas toyohensis]SMB99795.1 transcriptional regulator, GntR family [Thermanaeromonas toyohensis ToBE]
MLYPGSSKPLHEQLKDILKQKIIEGEFKPGEALPGERQLMHTYGVSRVTVRQAIGELVSEGLLYRQHGRGTFVAPRRIERPLAYLLGVAEELILEGLKVGIKVLEAGRQDPLPEIRQQLRLKEGEQVFHVLRLIMTGPEPLLLDFSFFPSVIGQILKDIDLSKDLIYTHLELYGYKISHGVQWISAGRASQEEAQYLQCKKGSPVLVVRRITYVEGELPISVSRTVYRADRYEYRVNLYRYPLKPKELLKSNPTSP